MAKFRVTEEDVFVIDVPDEEGLNAEVVYQYLQGGKMFDHSEYSTTITNIEPIDEEEAVKNESD